jgi:hypothetical protein
MVENIGDAVITVTPIIGPTQGKVNIPKYNQPRGALPPARIRYLPPSSQLSRTAGYLPGSRRYPFKPPGGIAPRTMLPYGANPIMAGPSSIVPRAQARSVGGRGGGGSRGGSKGKSKGFLESLGIRAYGGIGGGGPWGGASINVAKVLAKIPLPIVAALAVVTMLLKKLWDTVKNTEGFKYMKTLFEYAVGTVVSMFIFLWLMIKNVLNFHFGSNSVIMSSVNGWMMQLIYPLTVIVQLLGFLVKMFGEFIGAGGIAQFGMDMVTGAEKAFRDLFPNSEKSHPLFTEQTAQNVTSFTSMAAGWGVAIAEKIKEWFTTNLIDPLGLFDNTKLMSFSSIFLSDSKLSYSSLFGDNQKLGWGKVFDLAQEKRLLPWQIVDISKPISLKSIVTDTAAFAIKWINTMASMADTLYNAFIRYFINPIGGVLVGLVNVFVGAINKIPGIDNISTVKFTAFPEREVAD